MEIKVTQRHINNARATIGPGMKRICPIEFALLDLGYEAKVYPSDVEFGKLASVALPENAKEFVYGYDEDNMAEPFTFDLDIPASVPKIAREE